MTLYTIVHVSELSHHIDNSHRSELSHNIEAYLKNARLGQSGSKVCAEVSELPYLKGNYDKFVESIKERSSERRKSQQGESVKV